MYEGSGLTNYLSIKLINYRLGKETTNWCYRVEA